MSNPQRESLILFDKVSKQFDSKLVLKELSLSIHENEYVALLGNNGCGKTTTINILCNLIPYDKGYVYVLGSKVTPSYIHYKNQLGIVLSSHYIIPEFSIIEYLRFVGRFQFVDKNELKRRLNDLINFFDLDDDKNKAIKNLSSGNKMKVSIAASLIHNPRILIYDEPFVNLDITTSQTLIDKIKTFHGKKTLLITSQNLDLVIDLCDRFLIMNDGIIISDITNDEGLSPNDLKEKIRQQLISERSFDTKLEWLT